MPNDPDLSEVILASQLEGPFDDLGRRKFCRVLGYRLGIDEDLFGTRGLPPLEASPPDAEIAAGFGNVSDLLSVPQDLELVLNNSIFAVHSIHSPGCQ